MTGNDLKRLRAQRKLTQTEFAKLLQYNSKTHIARLEARGRQKLPISALARIKASSLQNNVSKRL